MKVSIRSTCAPEAKSIVGFTPLRIADSLRITGESD
jgi:hypothetical protein